MDHECKEEILSLLESPELREYLLAPPEKLCCAQYAEIICGAPVSLYRKRELLLRLKAETPEEDLWAILGALHCIEDALKALEQADASDAYLSVELIGYDAEERRTDTIDGPYPVRSLAEARQAVRSYRADCEDTDREVGAYCDEHDYNWTADDWETRFWTMELYDLNQQPRDDGFRRPVYIYVLSPEGEPLFFSQQQLVPGLRTQCCRALGMGGLVLPTPYKPGDILRIDCRPFVPMPFYCLLIQARSGSCGLWCLFPNLDGGIGQGALLNGRYFAQEYDFSWRASYSPLYRAEVFTGELPENCRFMKELSEKIHADPGCGDLMDRVLCDLKL